MALCSRDKPFRLTAPVADAPTSGGVDTPQFLRRFRAGANDNLQPDRLTLVNCLFFCYNRDVSPYLYAIMTAKKKGASSDTTKSTSKKTVVGKPETKQGYMSRIHGHVRKQKGGNR